MNINRPTVTIVALRKESVDRNPLMYPPKYGIVAVALRKESVDRNLLSKKNRPSVGSRSPQGERG